MAKNRCPKVDGTLDNIIAILQLQFTEKSQRSGHHVVGYRTLIVAWNWTAVPPRSVGAVQFRLARVAACATARPSLRRQILTFTKRDVVYKSVHHASCYFHNSKRHWAIHTKACSAFMPPLSSPPPSSGCTVRSKYQRHEDRGKLPGGTEWSWPSC